MRLLSLVVGKTVSGKHPCSIIGVSNAFEGSCGVLAEVEDALIGIYHFRLLGGDGREIESSRNISVLAPYAYTQLSCPLRGFGRGPHAVELVHESAGKLGRRYFLGR